MMKGIAAIVIALTLLFQPQTNPEPAIQQKEIATGFLIVTSIEV